MDPKNKFKIKTFLKYLVVEPWTEKFSLPNPRSLNIIFLCVCLYLRWTPGIITFVITMVLMQGMDEYRKGEYYRWYRNRQNQKFGNYKEAIKQAKQEKNENEELSN